MKVLSIITAILLFTVIGIVAFLNWQQEINFQYYFNSGLSGLSLGILVIAVSICASVASLLLAYSKFIELNSLIKKHMRSVEKANIETEEYNSKIKSLQAKIDTLEIALKEALSK